jgi:hypothetical protein
MSGRFDYVAYDDAARSQQAALKNYCECLEASIETQLPGPGRAKSLALTKLEECYAWLGKEIRDRQVAKRGAELQEGRSNG